MSQGLNIEIYWTRPQIKKTKALFEKRKRHAGVARKTLCVIVEITAYSLNKSGDRPELTVERR